MKAALQIALCWRRNSADSALQSAQEWHRGGLGCEFLFIPLQWLREKGWLVCPTSKRCLLFGYRDKKARPHVEESSHCHGGKGETKPPRVFKWRQTPDGPEECFLKMFFFKAALWVFKDKPDSLNSRHDNTSLYNTANLFPWKQRGLWKERRCHNKALMTGAYRGSAPAGHPIPIRADLEYRGCCGLIDSKQTGYFLVNRWGRSSRDLPVTPADGVTSYLQEAFAKSPPVVCRLWDLDHWL